MKRWPKGWYVLLDNPLTEEEFAKQELARALQTLKLVNDSLPNTYFSSLPLNKRVTYLVQDWQRALSNMQLLENQLMELREAILISSQHEVKQ